MYTVVAQRQIPLPVMQVWDYLTVPELLAKWFADARVVSTDEPLLLEFGDGDFFSGRIIEWEPGIIFGVRWKFVGHGPEYEVRYSLLPRKQGTELSIQDRGGITLQEAECLRVGWSEFLLRLEKAIVKNVSTRFAWRKAITFTVGVDSINEPQLLTALRDAAWYERSLANVNARVNGNGNKEIHVAMTSAGWGKVTTNAHIATKQTRSANYLLVAHEGWAALPGETAPAERKRFVAVWLNALREFGVS